MKIRVKECSLFIWTLIYYINCIFYLTALMQSITKLYWFYHVDTSVNFAFFTVSTTTALVEISHLFLPVNKLLIGLLPTSSAHSNLSPELSFKTDMIMPLSWKPLAFWFSIHQYKFQILHHNIKALHKATPVNLPNLYPWYPSTAYKNNHTMYTFIFFL